MEVAQRYRKHAQDCRDLAERADDAATAAILRELAYHWDKLAELRERLITTGNLPPE